MMNKYKVILSLIFLTATISAQDKLSVQELKTKIQNIEHEIAAKQDSVKKLKSDLASLETRHFLADTRKDSANLSLEITLKKGGNVFKEPTHFSRLLTKLSKGRKIKLINYKNDFWLIETGIIEGYLPNLFVEQTDTIKTIRDRLSYLEQLRDKKKQLIEKALAQKQEEEHRKKRLAQRAEKEHKEKIAKKKRENELSERYGEKNANKILRNKYWIGMTEKMARESLGWPDDIRNIETAFSKSTTYTYFKDFDKRRYSTITLSFNEGVLTTIQDYFVIVII